MENEIISFTNKEFGEIRSILIDNEPWFVGKDICKALDISNPTVAMQRLDEDERAKFNLGRQGEANIVNEYGLYNLIMASRKSSAKKFKRWVTHDVLPSIRKTGSYSITQKPDSYMIDDPIERAKRWIEEEQERQALKLENTKLTNEVIYKEDVIINLVDSISTADKRQVLNRVVRKGGKNYSERWNALYKEFEAKYHCDVKRRMDNYNENHKPKLRNKLDYIDKVMNKIPELYEIACKLYENDVKELVSEMYYLNDLDTDLQKVIN